MPACEACYASTVALNDHQLWETSWNRTFETTRLCTQIRPLDLRRSIAASKFSSSHFTWQRVRFFLCADSSKNPLDEDGRYNRARISGSPPISLKPVLNEKQRSKINNTDDAEIYKSPTYVCQVDAEFDRQLSALYEKYLSPDMRVFDMMSSCDSHLPNDMWFPYVEGHGMNGEELSRNLRLSNYFVQNLNELPVHLPVADQYFDAVLCCIGIHYLQYPEHVLADVYRILKPGGLLIVTFSNRMIYEKTVAAWRDASEPERVDLVRGYVSSIFVRTPELGSEGSSQGEGWMRGYEEVEVVARPSPSSGVYIARELNQLRRNGLDYDPFYAVVCRRT